MLLQNLKILPFFAILPSLISSSALPEMLNSRSPGQVNYYSDARCKQYVGTWPGADKMYSNKDIDVGGTFIGSIIMLPDSSNTFDSLAADNNVIVGGGSCPADGKSPILRDANGNECYVVGAAVNKIELYTAVCATISSEK